MRKIVLQDPIKEYEVRKLGSVKVGEKVLFFNDKFKASRKYYTVTQIIKRKNGLITIMLEKKYPHSSVPEGNVYVKKVVDECV